MKENDEIKDILAYFPASVTLSVSKPKWLLMLVGSCLGTALGYWSITFKGGWSAWLFTLFLGLVVVVSAVQLIPGASYLKLDKNGYEVRTLFRRARLSWSEVSDFKALRVGLLKLVLFRYSSAGKIYRLKIDGRNATLTDTYGFAADELAQLMNEWHSRAINA